MEEEWAFIPDFEGYMVSNLGRIQNQYTGEYRKLSQSNHGHMRVTVRSPADGPKSFVTLTVRVEVARAFVQGRTDIFTDVIQLDNNKRNCRADNLAWRPHWFAWKYARQFDSDWPSSYYNRPIENTRTGAEYENAFECAQIEGVLVTDIWRSVMNQGYRIFPDGGMYDLI